MRSTRTLRCVVLAVIAAAPRLGAQPLADRVNAVRDGLVQVTYAARPDACGDGADAVALGRLYVVYPSVRGHGWSQMNCTFGPARAIVTRRDGEVTAVRVHVGTVRAGDRDATDLGTVSAREAASYFLRVASTGSGRAASWAVMAAAVADSTDIWRDLLDLARKDDRPSDVRNSALYWLSGIAPAEALGTLVAIVRDGNAPKSLREGVIMTLGQMRDGAGVPSLIEMTRRDGDQRWIRERAIFWLGNTDDDRARSTLRALAASDTLARDLREGAIFALGFLDQRGGNGPFLRSLYSRLDDKRLKDKVIQAVAQLDAPEDQQWLVARVLDPSEPVDLRKQALFWRGQKNGSPLGDLIALYPRLDSRELREHYVFVLSQRQERDAVDKLIDIARNDPDRGLRAKAVFWLGQSHDPRAAKFLEEAIAK